MILRTHHYSCNHCHDKNEPPLSFQCMCDTATTLSLIIRIISSISYIHLILNDNLGSRPHLHCFVTKTTSSFSEATFRQHSTYLGICRMPHWVDWGCKTREIRSSGRTGWRTCPGNSLGRSGTPYPVSATGPAGSTLEKEFIRRPSTGMIRKHIGRKTGENLFTIIWITHSSPHRHPNQPVGVVSTGFPSSNTAYCIRWGTQPQPGALRTEPKSLKGWASAFSLCAIHALHSKYIQPSTSSNP